MAAPAVVDASAAVKWFKDEAGSAEAWGLLEAHARGEMDLHMPQQCVGEMLAVVARSVSTADAISAWVSVGLALVERHDFTDELLRETRRHLELLGCVFCDALAPALATVLGAQLYSADRHAHAHYPGVQFVG